MVQNGTRREEFHHDKARRSTKTTGNCFCLFLTLKSDFVKIGEIISRFERRGYKLVAAKMMTPSVQLAKQHYAEHDGKPFFEPLVNFLTSGPVFAMVWEGKVC